MKMGKICGIDLGDSRTGIAFSDALRMIAGRSEVIHEKNTAKLMDRLVDIIRASEVVAAAVGCPVNMDGSHGPRAEKAEKLAQELRERTGIRIDLVDERRTTVDAYRILSDNGVYGQKRKNSVDAVAAVLILETYMGMIKTEEEKSFEKNE